MAILFATIQQGCTPPDDKKKIRLLEAVERAVQRAAGAVMSLQTSPAKSEVEFQEFLLPEGHQQS